VTNEDNLADILAAGWEPTYQRAQQQHEEEGAAADNKRNRSILKWALNDGGDPSK
jgi:hypothetical protein